VEYTVILSTNFAHKFTTMQMYTKAICNNDLYILQAILQIWLFVEDSVAVHFETAVCA
jgi:hypothetical protein